MEQVQGVEISNLGFVPQKLGDLLEHEGPLLSLFVDQENPENHYVYKWVDQDNVCNRWMILPCSTKELNTFFNKSSTLRALVSGKPYCFLMDVDGQLLPHKFQVVAIEKLPEDYLPTEKSYYQEEVYSLFAAEYLKELAQNTNDRFDSVLKEISDIKASQKEATRVLKDLLKLQASS